MSLETLDGIRSRLLGKKPQNPSMDHKAFLLGQGEVVINKSQLIKEINRRATDLHARFQIFGEILSYKRFGGKLDIGTNPDEINWDAMPEGLAECFRPEFNYQPGEISAFTITPHNNSSNGEIGITIQLFRNDRWWSNISVGAINRENYKGSSVYFSCFAEQAQPTDARRSMKSLGESLWGGTLGSQVKELPLIVNNINSLEFSESVLNYATGLIQNQMNNRP